MALYHTPHDHLDDAVIRASRHHHPLPELPDRPAFTELVRETIFSSLSIDSDQCSVLLDNWLEQTAERLLDIHRRHAWTPINFADACRIAQEFFDSQDISGEAWRLEENDCEITAVMLVFSVVLSDSTLRQRLRRCAADEGSLDDVKSSEVSAAQPPATSERHLRIFFDKDLLTDAYFSMILNPRPGDELVTFERKLGEFMKNLCTSQPLYGQYITNFMQRGRNALGLKNHIFYGGVLKADRRQFQDAFDFVHSFYKCLVTGRIHPHDDKWIAMGLRVGFRYEFTNRQDKEQQRDPPRPTTWTQAFAGEEFVEMGRCSWEERIIGMFASAEEKRKTKMLVPISLLEGSDGRGFRFAHTDPKRLADGYPTEFPWGLHSKNDYCISLSKFLCLQLWHEMVSVNVSVVRDVRRMYLTLGPIRSRIQCAEDISTIFRVMSGLEFRIGEGLSEMPPDEGFDVMHARLRTAFDVDC